MTGRALSAIGRLLTVGTLLTARRCTATMSTRLFDEITDLPSVPSLPGVHWFDEVSSTMDTAREMVTQRRMENLPIACVVADRQTNGRGTKGRKWFFGRKNVFMTIIVHRKYIPIPLHLLPLRSGTLVGAALEPHIEGTEIKLKWPNDVLVEGKKLCGMLIEMEGDYLLVGIGCNLVTAPSVADVGAENGRPSTSLIKYSPRLQELAKAAEAEGADGRAEELLGLYCKMVTMDIYGAFHAYVNTPYDTARQVLVDFERNMDMSIQRLRQDHFEDKGEGLREVEPLGLSEDGTLRVRHLHNGEIVTLVAEYLR